MAENTELDAFLSGGAQPGSGPSAEAAPEPEAPPAPEPEQKSDAAGGGDKKPPDAAPEPDDAEPPEPREGEALVPRRAFEAVRHERQDWKSKAVAAETTAAELRRQLEEAKRPQPPYQPPTPPPEIPNPAHDPAGYHAYIQQERIRDSINDRLNLSEVLALEKYGAEKIAAMKAEFLAAKEADPRLGEQLIRQPHPYEWAMAQVEKLRAHREIGDDPAAYRERIRAEAIAEFQKNGGVSPPRVSPAAGMPPSLANARSVAGRSAPPFTGPPSLDDIVASIHRK